ncbi:hypothetical protein PL81_18490 [Streptomyces sp. RSD-27]|nr:hypothetical protein PL81_18490 [Streptomyces sp. RSD-27]
MVLAIGALLALAIRRSLPRTPHCGWCATASNWPTSRHDALPCRGYVLDRRGERLRDIKPANEGRRMSTETTTAAADFAQVLAESADGDRPTLRAQRP